MPSTDMNPYELHELKENNEQPWPHPKTHSLQFRIIYDETQEINNVASFQTVILLTATSNSSSSGNETSFANFH